MAKQNYIIDDPKGVDNPIQDIQDFLFNRLAWTDFDIYGRVFKIISDKGKLPRAFIPGKEYKDVFTDDRRTASIFFIVDDQQSTKQGIMFTAKVKVVFMVNLKKLFPDLTKRGDTDAQMMAVELINEKRSFNFNGEIQTDVDEVFKGFNTDGLKLTDLGNYHVFSLNGEINYTVAGNGCIN